MFSNLMELAGFVFLAAAAYEWSGRALALLTAAVAFFVLGLAVEGVYPLRSARGLLSRRWQAARARRTAKGIASPTS